MKFMVVNRPARAQIFGHEYDLKPLRPPKFEPENILVADNGSASELLERHRSVLLEAAFDTSQLHGFPIMPGSIDQVKPGSKIVIMKAGGVGDHVMLLPALAAFRSSLASDVTVWFSTQKEKHPIFYSSQSVDKLLPLPLTLDKMLEADFIIDFSDSLDNDDFNTLNMTDYYMKILGLDEKMSVDKSPIVQTNSKQNGKIRTVINELKNKRSGKPLVVIQWNTSNPLRNVPPEMFLDIVESFPEIQFITPDPLIKKGIEKDMLKHTLTKIIDFSPWIRSLEDYITMFELCDGSVSTDTAAYHLAEAFGKPSLTLFGPISSDLRMRYYKKAYAVNASYIGKSCKSPCGLHKTKRGCPEAEILKTSYSPCFLSIDPEAIYKKFEKMCCDFNI